MFNCFKPNTKCLSKNVAIKLSYSPLFHGILLILTLPEILLWLFDINFKSLNFKNLTKILLVLTVYSKGR